VAEEGKLLEQDLKPITSSPSEIIISMEALLIKKMLVVSESLFFGEAKAAPLIHRDAKPALIAVRTGRK
jgi:hypothetical protein